MKKRSCLFMLISCLVITSGCDRDEKKISQPPATIKKAVLAAPFRFHKLIEVSPGDYYDVLSWGRGSNSVGAFVILHSDSLRKKYTTTTGNLDGSIVDVYNSDMDLDGNPEILIQAKVADTANYATIYVVEFTNGAVNKLDFPKLTSAQHKGYHGNDNFYIKEGKLMREFPIYNGNDKDAKPTGAKRILEYGLRNNSFTVKQLSLDSADNKNIAKPVVAVGAKTKAAPIEKKEATPKKKPKKHIAEKKEPKKKKKHHKHHSNDD